MIQHKLLQTLGYTVLALIAFAANSVLCRVALKDDTIDPSSFTSIRLLSGILMFVLLLAFSRKTKQATNKKQADKKPVYSWLSGAFLFTYAIAFSYAYVSLETGVGALVLFGAVQVSMIIASFVMGNKLSLWEWLGLSISFSGLVYLLYPTLATPSIFGFMLMTLSGIAWGMYTILGRNSQDPFKDTAANFKYTAPLVLVLFLATLSSQHISLYGAVLAVASGALASALGYTIWFMALKGLSETEAAVVQLSVPVIAAFGGVFFASEAISMRLIVACVLVLGGIVLVMFGRVNNAKQALEQAQAKEKAQ